MRISERTLYVTLGFLTAIVSLAFLQALRMVNASLPPDMGQF